MEGRGSHLSPFLPSLHLSPPTMQLDRVRRLTSRLDSSVNWLIPFLDKRPGMVETRFVQKKPEYFISYVSSSIGCNQGCKQCFLTQNGQTAMHSIDVSEYLQQLRFSLDHYRAKPPVEKQATRININFMARGEPFLNRHVLFKFADLYHALDSACAAEGLKMKLNLSTIMPGTMRFRTLEEVLPHHSIVPQTYLYYSLYSTNETFRKLWMPNAMPWQAALEKLKVYQANTNPNVITFHWPFIAGQNDKQKDIDELADAFRTYRFKAKLNVVRYNNHPNLPHQETPLQRIREIYEQLNEALGDPTGSYIVPRVGQDISASCGMFEGDRGDFEGGFENPPTPPN